MFRFGKVNANTTLQGKHISSPGFGVKAPTAPASENDSSLSSIPTPTELGSGTTSAGNGASGSSGAAEAASESAQDEDSGGLAAGAKAGIGVGAVVGAVALIGLGWFVSKKSMWIKASRGSGTEEEAPKPALYDAQNRFWGHGPLPPYAATSAPSQIRCAELDAMGRHAVSELGSDR